MTNRVTFFLACSARGKLIPVIEDPPSPLKGVCQRPQELLRDKIHNADGVILISDHSPCEVPDCLQCVCTQHFNGHMYSWISYGLTCSLLGGLVHNRRVAMQLRWLLEDSQNLLVGRILPRPCYFEKLYSVDPMWETPEPCVL